MKIIKIFQIGREIAIEKIKNYFWLYVYSCYLCFFFYILKIMSTIHTILWTDDDLLTLSFLISALISSMMTPGISVIVIYASKNIIRKIFKS